MSIMMDQGVGTLAKIQSSPSVVHKLECIWLNILHRETKVYLNCDQCSHDGKIISVEQPDDHDYVILTSIACCHINYYIAVKYGFKMIVVFVGSSTLLLPCLPWRM